METSLPIPIWQGLCYFFLEANKVYRPTNITGVAPSCISMSIWLVLSNMNFMFQIYGIILPIGELIFFKMVIAPPASQPFSLGFSSFLASIGRQSDFAKLETSQGEEMLLGEASVNRRGRISWWISWWNVWWRITKNGLSMAYSWNFIMVHNGYITVVNHG